MTSRPAVIHVGRRGALVLGAISAITVAAFAWPFLVPPAPAGDLAHAADAPWIMLAAMPLLIAVLVSELTAGRIDAKAIALLGVLSAAGAALRLPTGGIAGLEIVFFLFIPAGRVLGRGFGLVLGAVTLFASGLLTGGIGPWLPFQMLAAGWVGFGAGCLPRVRGRAELAVLGAYAVVASFAYGLAMDLWFWPFGASSGTALSFVAGDSPARNLRRFAAFHVATSMGWDVGRAVSMIVMIAVLGRPVLAALRRVADRAAFDTPAQFDTPAPPQFDTPALPQSDTPAPFSRGFNPSSQ